MINIEQIKATIKPLTFSGGKLSSEEEAYSRYYGIDLDVQIAGVSHQMGFIETRLCRIVGHVYQPVNSKGTFFLVHGYYDNVGLYGHVIRLLLQQQYTVCTYDLPGHGLSDGKRATIDDFSSYTQVLTEVIEHVQGHLPKPWHGYGQSTGCAILTEFLLERTKAGGDLVLDKIVLSAPLVRPYRWSWGRIQLYLLRPFIHQLPRHFTNNSRNQAFLEFARKEPLAPRILPVEWVNAMDRWIRRLQKESSKINCDPFILQGTHDRTVDAAYNIPFLKKLYKQPKIFMLEGAGHHLPNELPETRRQYMEWLSSVLQ
ncbi:2-succinyl-6-hydroxy-2,4-cyclohexadiene-1-carboxylate synthase [invertebrate metagenome]|uniref:2-succinyl-6-hydroxy-2, 4-cyclohexadiene-1-carboxylate synthase n=1 Tax=invertebrate metagenome TaxID=1711999 RepID=A0A2H9T936_9ZZZZ